MQVPVIKKLMSPKDIAALRGKNTDTLLQVVDEALKKYGSDLLSVDKNEGGMFAVNLCSSNWSDCFKNNIVCYGLCDLHALVDGLNQRHVGYCF